MNEHVLVVHDIHPPPPPLLLIIFSSHHLPHTPILFVSPSIQFVRVCLRLSISAFHYHRPSSHLINQLTGTDSPRSFWAGIEEVIEGSKTCLRVWRHRRGGGMRVRSEQDSWQTQGNFAVGGDSLSRMASSSTWTTPSGIAGAACGNGHGLGQQLRSSSSRSLRISKRDLNRTHGGVQGQVNDLTQHYLSFTCLLPQPGE